MNVNIPPHPTPTHAIIKQINQKTEKKKHQKSNKTPRCPAAPMATSYPLVNIQKAIEHGHLYLIYPLKIVVFHSYVSLPEGISN